MRRRVAAIGVALCTLGLVAPPPAGANGPPAGPTAAGTPAPPNPVSAGPPGFTYTYRSDAPTDAGTPGDDPARLGAHALTTSPRTPPAPMAGAFRPPPNDDFVFEFDDVDPSRRAAFVAAAGIWSGVLEVEVPIAVRVSELSFTNPNILGGAEPTDIHANDVSFPTPNVWFVSAHANQFAGRDLDPTQPEIDIVISSDFDFYLGVDDRVPSDQTSLLSLAVHELGHGLGHITLARPQAGTWAITWPGPQGTLLPLAYDLFLVDTTRTPLTQLSPTALGVALTSRVLWSGGEGVRADGGLLPEMYAPARFQVGSSTSHLDERTYPSGLMTPNIADGEAFLAVPELTQAMFADFGWGLEVSGQDAAFVTALSRDFIHSFPKPAEIDFVVSILRAGTPRRDVVDAYASSDAYLGRLLDTYYLSTLDRPADAGGKQHWLQQLRAQRTPASVAAAFYASTEYFRTSGSTSRGWITDLYIEILGRQPDGPGLDSWLRMAAAGTSRTDIAFAFYQSVESRTKRVTDLYRHLLGRTPEPAGLLQWREVLDDGRDVALAVELARSPEYQDRAFRRFG